MNCDTIYNTRINDDFNNGKKLLHDLKNNVTIFGSARTHENNFYAQKAQKLGYILANEGINIITGGGDGIMQAANKGGI